MRARRVYDYAPSQLDSQGGYAQPPAHDCQGEYFHHLLAIVKVSMLRRARKHQDEWMYHQLTTIQVNVLHHRRATVNEVCFSTRKLATAKMIMLFCKLLTTAGVHHGSGCSAAPQRKSGEMGASGRLQKRTKEELARGINFLLALLLIFVCFLNTWKKQKQKENAPCLLSSLVVFKGAFAFSLACQKEQDPPLF